MLMVILEPRSSPASNRGGRSTRGKVKRASHLAESARNERRGSKASIEDSVDDEDRDAMDVDAEDNLRVYKPGASGSTRRSVRKR